MENLILSDTINQVATDTIASVKDVASINLATQFKDLLVDVGISEKFSEYLQPGIFIIIIILLAFLSDLITKKIIVAFIKRLVKKTKTTLDDIFLENKVFNRLSHLVPSIIIYYTINVAIGSLEDPIVVIVRHAASIYMIIVGLSVIDSLFTALIIIYRRLPVAKNIVIKSYVQVLKIIIYLIGIVWIFSIVFSFELDKFFTGLGAFVAVLILVFKDTILGFVASIQISTGNMVKVGDWISMPKYNADGTVEDINVYTVKVRNWNKTISTIPTQYLVSESFSNWRGMEESGGRRIKRSINIDMKSVKFCDAEMIDKFGKFHIIKDYINEAVERVAKYNLENKVDDIILVNGRRLTNLGTFRKYVEAYLHNNDKIHDDMTFLVRQLQPSERGIPLEIYVFSNDQAWANYEAIQADIFDHLLAVIPEFGLKVFQDPTGDDFRKLTQLSLP